MHCLFQINPQHFKAVYFFPWEVHPITLHFFFLSNSSHSLISCKLHSWSRVAFEECVLHQGQCTILKTIIRISTKTLWILPLHMLNLFSEFHETTPLSFYVILLANKQAQNENWQSFEIWYLQMKFFLVDWVIFMFFLHPLTALGIMILHTSVAKIKDPLIWILWHCFFNAIKVIYLYIL